MAILHSCCLWRSLRKGSYASAVYTLMYFLTAAVIAATFLHEQRAFLAGDLHKPSGESFLERQAITSTTVIFNIILLICGLCGIITALLLIAGLKTNQRELLLPWIFVMMTNMAVELAHFLYILITSLQFDTFTATIFTIDFFLNCLNTYSLLCVISQYQELRAGRGISSGQGSIFGNYRNVQYVPPAITTSVCQEVNTNNNNNSCSVGIGGGVSANSNLLVKSKRAVKTSLLCPHTQCTMIPEETQINASPDISVSWQEQNGTSTNEDCGHTDKELAIL